jgi:hypothetical protein
MRLFLLRAMNLLITLKKVNKFNFQMKFLENESNKLDSDNKIICVKILESFETNKVIVQTNLSNLFCCIKKEAFQS